MPRLFLFLFFVLHILLLGAQNINPQQYISTYRDIAIREMIIYRIPASITLAQGIIESSYGNSILAQQANNHFGIKCHLGWEGDSINVDDDAPQECFRKYVHAEESFKDHSLFLRSRPRYALLFDLPITDYKAWAYGLKAAGYATNPNYPELLIRQVERYQLFTLDTISMMPIGLSGSSDPQLVQLSNASGNQQQKYDDITATFSHPGLQHNHVEGSELSLSGRNIYMNNRVKYIHVNKNESLNDICNDLSIMPWQVYRYNDIPKGYEIKAGEILYIQPKRKKSKITEHLVTKGESMWKISQIYGIRLKYLYKMNAMSEGTPLADGQNIKLR